MYKIFFTLIISSLLSTALYASGMHRSVEAGEQEPISSSQIQRMDRQLTKHQAVKRAFRTKKEFQHHRNQKKYLHPKNKMVTSQRMRYSGRFHHAYHDTVEIYHPGIRQRGHYRPKRGWFLAYLYDRASFYDHEGFHYGYFNRYGYYFEGIFYRYDRDYTYRDRLRGRGLFDNRYYMPSNYRYYGFCGAGYENRPYYRR